MPTWQPKARQIVGSLVLLTILLAATGCTGWVGTPTIGVDLTFEYSQPVSGETPGTIASACGAAGGSVHEGTGGDQTTCTIPNGDAKTCDWQKRRCHTVCHSTQVQCEVLRDLAWVAPWLRKGTPTLPVS
jgi:hypothetical protein